MTEAAEIFLTAAETMNSTLCCSVCVSNYTVYKLINANRSLPLASPPSSPVTILSKTKQHGQKSALLCWLR